MIVKKDKLSYTEKSKRTYGYLPLYEASWLRVLHYTKILKGAHYKIIVCGKDDHGDDTLIKKIMHTGQQTWCFLDL